ncbi:GbsR/MarR family transcriptional regulator [Pseudooceanicola sp.]|jgi:DNA-binding transcriptional regulator GbsR (MarR family)|uniref:GbsR/MarR family transcriptional regulator n=1 Tax=Pseudooceanicola sp. TaxID=1914328 RepID=UPI0035156104
MSETPTDRFIETLGLIYQSEGAPRIAGMILALLLMSDRPMSLAEIAGRLGISKASASTNTRLLERRGMASKTRGGGRQDFWEADPDPQSRVLPALAERFRGHARAVQGVARTFPPEEEAKRAKIARFAAFYDDSAEFLDAWSARLTAMADPSPETN